MRKPSTYQIAIAGVILLIIFVLYTFGKEFQTALSRFMGNEAAEPVDYEDTPLPIDVPLTDDFDATPYVVRLIEVLRFLLDSSVRCDAYKDLLALNDAEFITVTNEYKHETGRTLRSDMDAQLYDGCNVLFNRYGVQVRDRMDALGVIG